MAETAVSVWVCAHRPASQSHLSAAGRNAWQVQQMIPEHTGACESLGGSHLPHSVSLVPNIGSLVPLLKWQHGFWKAIEEICNYQTVPFDCHFSGKKSISRYLSLQIFSVRFERWFQIIFNLDLDRKESTSLLQGELWQQWKTKVDKGSGTEERKEHKRKERLEHLIVTLGSLTIGSLVQAWT